MNILQQALKLAAKKTLRKKLVSDEVAQQRMAICVKCPNYDSEDQKCRVCGCFMEVKTTCETNYNPKKLRHEITHCPEGRWGDVETANTYRSLDGLKPLNFITDDL